MSGVETTAAGTDANATTRLLRLICAGHGAFYFLGGVWPLLSPSTFQRVTGWKEDFWLAQTVGALLVVVGLVLLMAARARRITREIALLGAGCALVIGVIDIFCVAAPRTTRAYWLDAMVEFALVAAWWIAWRRHAQARGESGMRR